MPVKNSYPELPEIPFERTKIDMPAVVVYARSLVGKYPIEAVRMAVAIFRNESANGTKGVNNNYAGIQADAGKWKNLPGKPIGTCVKDDSAPGYSPRRFLCFTKEDGYKISFELLCIKVVERNMLTAFSYYRKWVGNQTITEAEAEKSWFNTLLASTKKSIP